MARGRDLMRFYCSNDVTRPLFSESVARRKTMDSIYRVNLRDRISMFSTPLKIDLMRFNNFLAY